jgi:hypothetical protein
LKINARNTPVFLLAFLLFGSCSLERKLAKEFIESKDSISVLLLMPDYVFMSNVKAWEISGFENLSEWQQDSALFVNSIFLKEIDEKFLVSRFENSMQTGFQKYGVKAYTDDQLLDFMDLEHKSYKVMLAQMELLEDIYAFRAEEVFFDTAVFYEDFDLNMVTIDTWFEVTRMNDPTATNNVLYASHYVMDGLEGRFAANYFTGEVKFHYNHYPIEVEDVYILATLLGEKYAGYVYDYLLNEYIRRQFPEGQQPKTYFTFNPVTRKLSPVRDDRFILMEK